MDEMKEARRMDVNRAIDIVERITYKKGWNIYVGRSYAHPYHVNVELEFYAPNSTPVERDPYGWVLAGNHFSFDAEPLRTTDDIVRAVLNGIIEAEMHEAREFLKIDGEAPFHPHRRDGIERFEATDHLARVPVGAQV